MNKHWKWMLATAAAVLLVVAGSLAEGTQHIAGARSTDANIDAAYRTLQDVSVETGDEGETLVRLAADGAVRYESFSLEGPRLVVDLIGVVSELDRYKFPVDRGGVARVRAAQHVLEPRPVTRVVFDLTEPVMHTIDVREGGLVVSFGDPAPAAATATPLVQAPADRPDVNDVVRELESRFVGLDVPEAQAVETVPATVVESVPQPQASRAVTPDLIDRLLKAPVLAAPETAPATRTNGSSTFETQRISSGQVSYSGKPISLNLVDADVKQVFRLFHEISGLNFVLDPSVSGRVTIVLDHVPWDQALDIILKNNGLDKVLENNVIRIAPTQKLAQEAASRKALKEAKDLEVEPITITRTLSYGKARDVERVIRDSGVLTTRGKVIVDERTNTLIISDIPKKVDPLDTLISTLDAETPQVMIEARVVETSREFVQDLGVDWGFEAIADASKGTATGLNFPHNASVKYGLNLPGDGGASNLAFKFGNVIDSFTLDVALNTLEREGSGRVLSSPKIATQNNERAEIEQGVRIPIVNTTATEINVEFVSASLKMEVTPQITAEGTIILDVIVENNSPDFLNTAGGIPSIRTQRAETKVLINDGGTTVIGGIFTVNEGKSESGVPWFRKMPVFGWLFKTQNITTQNRELLIFITPKIMRVA